MTPADEAWDRLSAVMRACSTCGGPLVTMVISGEVRCASRACVTSGRILARTRDGMLYGAGDPRGVRPYLPPPAALAFQPSPPRFASAPINAWKGREVLREHAISRGRRWVSR